uniref:ubiquitin carboxyl-terminal hydrolase 16-like n=1 Tax=Styela clava TaxID=7725 RepID=UPI0019393282|nr:ubiquitin carboxyl-terminal hydrolase 16-like [Styela clava]
MTFHGDSIMAKKRTTKQRAAANAAKNSKNATAGNRKIEQQSDEVNLTENLNIQRMRDVKKNVQTANMVYAPPKGLVNLGNTCFFNSVMQNLCRTPGLLQLLTHASQESNFVVDGENIPSIQCRLPPLCKLTEALCNFLITMEASVQVPINSAGRQRSRTESPKSLFNQICTVAPRFRGYQQQDSQEVLQALLDGVKTEEIKRRKHAILANLGLLKKTAKDISQDTKEMVKNYGRQASRIPTIVDSLFSGTLVSSVLCDECGQITQVTEDFLDIPLPIVESVQAHHNVNNKKSNKAQPIKDELNSGEDNKHEITNKVTSSSKHAKKKQRQQSRKNHRRRRTKSQNIEEASENDEIKEIVTEMQSMGINGRVGTDFSTNQASNWGNTNSDIEPEEINSESNNIVSELQQCKIVSAEIGIIEDTDEKIENENKKNDVVSELNNNYLVGEKNSPDTTAVAENGTAINETTSSSCDILENKETQNGGENLPDITTKTIKNTVAFEESSSSCEDILKNNEQTEEIHTPACTDGKIVAEDDVVQMQLSNGNAVQCGLMNGNAEIKQSEDEQNADSTPSDHTEPSSGNDEKEESGNEIAKDNCPSLFETPKKKPEVKFTSFCSKLPITVSPRYEPGKQECSIQSCLHKFTMAEMLTGNNKFGCEECTKRQRKLSNDKPKTMYCNASKQMMIKTPPLILTLQLKRFQQSGRSLRKFSKRVEIPIEFDLSPFCASDDTNHTDDNGQIMYRIYGIVEHSGSLSRGHYTSYVNVRPVNKKLLQKLGLKCELNNMKCGDEFHDQWFHISDTSVSKCTLDRALNSNAYLLFYERIF